VPAGAWLGLAAGAALEAAGWSMARAAPRGRRLLGWEVQALGLAVLAGAWFLGMALAG
jgi:hypothetical protein